MLVHSGQNYDPLLSDIFFGELSIAAPSYHLGIGTEFGAAAAIGHVISRFDEVLTRERPDAVLIYGDTNTGLGAIAARRRRVPVFHMEAGNRAFDARIPEEVNRRVIDHLSDVNMTNSEHARRYLIMEGLRPELVLKTGSPMREVLDHHREQVGHSEILRDLNLRPGGYFVVSAHREENVDDPVRLRSFVATLERLANDHQKPVIVSTHPRTRARLANGINFGGHELVRFLEPFSFSNYIRLQTEALCVVSDSGTLTEEASLLGFPAVMIREAHERPEGTDVGAVVFTPITPDSVASAVDLVTTQGSLGVNTITDYSPANVSKVVVRTIVSFVPYLRRTIWFGAPPIFS